ncbi:formylmethanofuran dehydrogenase, subunit B (plasmid) [Paraburkholderia caribensis MBA4]|uniref:Formylmethanofuran dehydrogenase, subunit B n=1 Tax=Paraburkholderia caribensis MBA4 TaxID=1323664 RepID=A0A0P0RMI6_9BURK|nr:formylmethanofuran dehydrogenase [Paraburkholderia caribensis]ALL70076.1 formylmethanofuran dehydrogenase, subunit B [Paraburkholderia caribensis MBA4]
MTSISSPTSWTCPFCPLLCDRLSIAAGETLTLSGTDCPRATRALAQFSARPAQAQPMHDGKPIAFDDAVGLAARWLAQAKQPLFAGMATDVAGTRALYRLANASAAIIDHAHGRSLMHGLTAMQDRGAFTTTLSEVRARSDLIVCFASTPTARYPAFFKRCGVGDQSGPARREVIFVGTEIDANLESIAQSGAVSQRAIPLHGDLYETVALLNARVDRLLKGLPMPGSAPALESLAAQMLAARYVTLVWSTADLPGSHATLLVEGLDRLAKSINLKTRAGCLALGGDDGGATVNQTLTWMSGLPLRTGVHRTGLEHDPHRYDTQRLLDERAVDALVWVASFGADLPPPQTSMPTIVLGHPGLAASSADRPGATLFIPVSTPGIGSAGHLFRTDGGVVLPLVPVYDDSLPTVAHVATQIAHALRAPHSTAQSTAKEPAR